VHSKVTNPPRPPFFKNPPSIPLLKKKRGWGVPSNEFDNSDKISTGTYSFRKAKYILRTPPFVKGGIQGGFTSFETLYYLIQRSIFRMI